ncbi:uncharacterized protein LOC131881509 isoform X2 [Tigriopus californicus]|nr:uncharacterized protein LOC131881509 isoform X2 [Tigriopus californicus]XP_059084379.1 uncharacterized protein LOC131881509 isoform X2 [Tigriopus californicus]
MPRNQSTNAALRDKCMKKFDHALRQLGDHRVPALNTTPTRPLTPLVTPVAHPTPRSPPQIHPNLHMAQVLTTLIEVLIYMAIGLTLVFMLALPFLRTKQIPSPSEHVFEPRSSRFLTAESLPIHEHSSARSSSSSSFSSASSSSSAAPVPTSSSSSFPTWRTRVGAHHVHCGGTLVGSSSTASQVIIHLPSIFEDPTSSATGPQSASSTSSLSTYDSPEISTLKVSKFQDQDVPATNRSGTCSNASTISTFVPKEEETRTKNGSMSEYYLNTMHAHDRREQSALERNERILSLFDFKDLV